MSPPRSRTDICRADRWTRAGRKFVFIQHSGPGSSSLKGKRHHRKNKVQGTPSAVQSPDGRGAAAPAVGLAGKAREGAHFVVARPHGVFFCVARCWTHLTGQRTTPSLPNSACAVSPWARRAALGRREGAEGARRRSGRQSPVRAPVGCQRASEWCASPPPSAARMSR